MESKHLNPSLISFNFVVFFMLLLSFLINITCAWNPNHISNDDMDFMEKKENTKSQNDNGIYGNGQVSSDTESSSDNENNGGGGGGGGGEELFFLRPANPVHYVPIRTYAPSMDTVRFMSPYALQHFLASKFQNPDYLGGPIKRIDLDESTKELLAELLEWTYLKLPKKLHKKSINRPIWLDNRNDKKLMNAFTLIKALNYRPSSSTFKYLTTGNEFLGGPGRR